MVEFWHWDNDLERWENRMRFLLVGRRLWRRFQWSRLERIGRRGCEAARLGGRVDVGLVLMGEVERRKKLGLVEEIWREGKESWRKELGVARGGEGRRLIHGIEGGRTGSSLLKRSRVWEVRDGMKKEKSGEVGWKGLRRRLLEHR